MKVSRLKELLAQCDDNDDIIMFADSEGNSFHPLSEEGVSIGVYAWDGEYYAEIGLRELTSELEQSGYSEDDVMEKGRPCIVLWP
jgi:hypothetical protein